MSPGSPKARIPLGQLVDDDSLRAADQAEPQNVLVVLNCAHGVKALALQSLDDVVKVVDGEGDVPDPNLFAGGG